MTLSLWALVLALASDEDDEDDGYAPAIAEEEGIVLERLPEEVLTLQPLMDWLKELPFRRQLATFADGNGSDVVLCLEFDSRDIPFIVRKGVGNNLFTAMLQACIHLTKPEHELHEPFALHSLTRVVRAE